MLSTGMQQPAAPYEPCGYLFTKAERSFLGVLDVAVGSEYRVMGKVRVADILKPRKGLDASDRTRALNRITAKHVDFLLCDPESLAVMAAIELDDKSHAAPARVQRDDFLAAAFAAAGVPLVRIPARSGYTPAAVREQLAAAGVNLPR
jgi:hypothetical protein